MYKLPLLILMILLFFSCNTSPKGKMETHTPNTYELKSNAKDTKTTTNATGDTVFITQMKFVPQTIRVNKGDTVVFVNKDFVKHDVTEEATQSWSSSVMNYGDVWSKIATSNEDYFCSLHVVMKGQIIIK